MSGRLRLVGSVVVLALLSCTPQASAASTRPGAQGTGRVAFLSSLAQPLPEAEAMRKRVLAGFGGSVSFISQPSEGDDVDKVRAQRGARGTVDVLALPHGGLATLGAADALRDLTPLLERLHRDRRFPPELLALGRSDTGRQFYIPWLQATYVMAVNRRALAYLPEGVRATSLTYDQLVAWGESLRQATGRRLVGLPAAPGIRGGLLNRFLQGYAYPAYTGGELTGFRSPQAVQMWQMLRRLWSVTNPQSTTYGSMSEPLERNDVWIAWDHQARLRDAVSTMGDQLVILPAPAGPRGLSSMTAIVGLAIPRNAPNGSSAEALIDWLTRPGQQALTASALAYLPVVDTGAAALPPYLTEEARVAAGYRVHPRAIAAQLEVGMGDQAESLKLAYQDTFTRIVLRGKSIDASLAHEARLIQAALDASLAPCWPPDPPSAPQTCRIR